MKTVFFGICLIFAVTLSCKDSEPIDSLAHDSDNTALFVLSSNRLSRVLSEAASELSIKKRNFSRDPKLVVDEYVNALPPEIRNNATTVIQSEQMIRFQRNITASKQQRFSKAQMLDFLNDTDLSTSEKNELQTLGNDLELASISYSSTIGEDGEGYNTEVLINTQRQTIESFENRLVNSTGLQANERINLLNITSVMWQSMRTYVVSSEDMLASMYPAEARCRFLCKLVRFIGAVVASVAIVAIVGAAIAIPVALFAGPIALAVGAAVGGVYALYQGVFNNTCYSISTSTGYGTTYDCWPE